MIDELRQAKCEALKEVNHKIRTIAINSLNKILDITINMINIAIVSLNLNVHFKLSSIKIDFINFFNHLNLVIKVMLTIINLHNLARTINNNSIKINKIRKINKVKIKSNKSSYIKINT